MLKKGFYCALGTPFDKAGNIILTSLKKHIESQISTGASGVLLMGTMGIGACVRDGSYEPAVRAAEEAVAGRVALMGGASDSSIARVKDRLHILQKYDVCPVLTPPFYLNTGRMGLINFFTEAAAATGQDIYLYDHEPITKHKLTYDIVLELSKSPNIKGIKSADPILIRQLHDSREIKPDFTPIFSNSDLFVMGYEYGIERYLDGIFACMPRSIGKVQRCFDAGDMENAKATLSAMMSVRDRMLTVGIWPAFTCAMNLLGFEGSFSPDYEPALPEQSVDFVKVLLQSLGEF